MITKSINKFIWKTAGYHLSVRRSNAMLSSLLITTALTSSYTSDCLYAGLGGLACPAAHEVGPKRRLQSANSRRHLFVRGRVKYQLPACILMYPINDSVYPWTGDRRLQA